MRSSRRPCEAKNDIKAFQTALRVFWPGAQPVLPGYYHFSKALPLTAGFKNHNSICPVAYWYYPQPAAFSYFKISRLCMPPVGKKTLPQTAAITAISALPARAFITAAAHRLCLHVFYTADFIFHVAPRLVCLASCPALYCCRNTNAAAFSSAVPYCKSRCARR
ncbi:hypothetical protein AABM17_233 [Neisseria musculi]|uniref:Uncharacterized protein n=1 Tax=Neisseria musculi TaxID=1815583 RepID=A0A7H1MCA9_9NEIS|nr:hypothetical protein H7A79_0234 [Neisseria musculi]